MKTKNLIILSLFSAISIVLTRFLAFYIPFFGSNDVRISLGDVPIMLAGLIFGPIAGALTGAVSDVIGATMFPAGPFFPGFTLSAMLAGAIPGLLQPFLRLCHHFYDGFIDPIDDFNPFQYPMALYDLWHSFFGPCTAQSSYNHPHDCYLCPHYICFISKVAKGFESKRPELLNRL
jgi:ECF transporter S component (folate family)